MSKLEDLIRLENANSALAFRRTPYRAGEREAFVIDMLALANSQVAGARLLVLGIDDAVGGKRRIKGVDREELVQLIASYQRTVAEYIEPALEISMRSLTLQGRVVAVIVVRSGEDQPYLVQKSISKRVRRGDGWIRRGTQQARLGRSDLQSMFKSRTLAGSMGCEIQVVFAGSVPSTRLELPALPLTAKPSVLAGQRIRGLLEAKQAAHEQLGKTDTRLNRLSHLRLFGADQPYETHTPESLLVQLARSEDENQAADEYYEHELRAHMTNLVVMNMGDGPLHGASITVEIPVTQGVDIARRIYPLPGASNDSVPTGYPKVESGARAIRIQKRLGRVEPGEPLSVFNQPLRLLLREAAVGCNVPFDYTLFGKELREPLKGSLHVQVTEDTQRLAASG